MIPPLIIESTAAAFGILGTTLLALNGKRAGWGFVAFMASNAGWLAFSATGGHWFMFAQQVAFTITSAIGIHVWLLRPWIDNYDEWRGDHSGHVAMYVKHVAQFAGRRVDVHTIVAADAPGCFHTHPAWALRIILRGGYTEELEDGTTRRWKPGMVGLVRPELSHRISAIAADSYSRSIWIRGRKCRPIELRGPGWPEGSTPA